MGKDKKKYAKILGRLDSATETVTLVWRGGHYGIGMCEGGGRLCYECNHFRGVADPVCFETLQAPQWAKFKLPQNKWFLDRQINEATMPWEDERVLVDVKLKEPSTPCLSFKREYTVEVRVTASMKLNPFVVKDPNPHKKHGVGFCKCFIPLEDVIAAAKSHRAGL